MAVSISARAGRPCIAGTNEASSDDLGDRSSAPGESDWLIPPGKVGRRRTEVEGVAGTAGHCSDETCIHVLALFESKLLAAACTSEPT